MFLEVFRQFLVTNHGVQNPTISPPPPHPHPIEAFLDMREAGHEASVT